MTDILEFTYTNAGWIRPIWFMLGIIGLAIFNMTRSKFYRQRAVPWWTITIVVYVVLGPMIFLLSLLSLINPNTVKKKFDALIYKKRNNQTWKIV